MSWVKWLKGLADRSPAEEGRVAPGERPAMAGRRPRKGGEAYAKEWVKVLEDSGPGRDPSSTYTWELQSDGPPAPASARPRAPKAKPADGAKADPFDTYTWELQEGQSAEDPWGVKGDAAPESKPKADGVNPYDTGIFDASWTGRFDQR